MTGGTPHEYGKGDDTTRVMAFSDGVFAIAITLLVLNLKVPPITNGSGLFATLGEQWPEFWAFLISFAVIGQLWIIHHSLFYYIVRYDRRLLWLNLLVLLCVSFMPFPTAILAESDHTRDAVGLYAFTLGVTFAVQLVIWQ